ncbi:hypothetical protein ACFL0Z_01025 [Patescibacteria group bacterium]
MQIKSLRLEGVTTWNDVFELWQEREGAREDWQRVAKAKGWQSWEDWRRDRAEQFGASDREWHRYTILDPLQTVPGWRVGPTMSWQKSFPEGERNQHTFADLVNTVSYNQNDKVQGMLKDFPEPTEFIGLLMPDKSVVIIEGHHRATTLAWAAKQGKKISLAELPTIALTEFNPDEEKLLDKMLARGSTKESSK